MIKLFDAISKRGWEVTRNRASHNNPIYAARRIKRRTDNGSVRFLDDYFTMDMWKEEEEIEQKYRPWWLIVSLHIHWWLDKYSPRVLRRDLRAYHQRGIRGWADRDTWSFDTYLAKVIRDGIAELNTRKISWPGDPLTFEEWTEILSEISDGMQAHLDLVDVKYDFQAKESKAEEILVFKRNLAMDHLKKYWFHLWD